MPPDCRANATTNESRTIPITSSMTAAPRIVVPSRERSAFSSISVCAEMLTLVAVRIVPMKMPVQTSGWPKAAATKAPAKSGQHDTTKRRPERHGTHPPHLHEIGLETRDEHQQNDADVGEILDGSEQGRRRRPVHDRVHGREDGPAEDVEKRRTQNQSGEDLAEDRRLPDAVRRRRGEFRGGDECGQQQQELEQMRHIGSEGVACIVPEPCRQPNW